MYLKIEAEKCTGCHVCESFCSFHHEEAIWPERARITVVAQSDDGPFLPNVCRQCGALSGSTEPSSRDFVELSRDAQAEGLAEVLSKGEDAPCAVACPAEAITLDKHIGAWVVDVEECTGCGSCVEACPYEAIFLDEQLGVSLKCDLCGGEPECAAMCPSGAIRMRTADSRTLAD